MIKKLLKKILHALSIDLTKNLRYDRLTFKIINQELKKDSVCIDIGCHLGEILEVIIKKAPHNNHYAFEPLPKFHHIIKNKFKANIFPYALSDKSGEIEFNYVENSPEYSGINKRNYLGLKNPKVSLIKVKTEKLDNIIPSDQKIDFIKIDVEGAEYNVLLGGKQTILQSKPLIVFEFEKASAEYYNTSSIMMFNLLNSDYEMDLYTLESFLDNEKPLKIEQFTDMYENNLGIYFVARSQNQGK